LLRTLFNALSEGAKYRRRSAYHERVWLSLTGYCLRPGFGYALDDWRINQIWPLYQQGLQFTNEIQNWSEWWIFWRRIAGGLNQEQQKILFKDISRYLNPVSANNLNVTKEGKKRSYDDIVKLAASLEHLSLADKQELGNWLIKRLQKASEPKDTWWAVGRIGARIPFYAGSHEIVRPEIVVYWLDNLIKEDWKKTPQAAFAATLLSRKTNDRLLNIDDAVKNQIIDKLRMSKMPQSWVTIIEQYQEFDQKEKSQFFGESLPAGLKLIHPS
jgi:hypothetical protein